MDIGLPKIDIIFKGLGVSAAQRGAKGTAILILKDDTDDSFSFAEYRDISKFTSTEQSKYTPVNVAYIKDALEGAPLIVKVFRMKTTDVLADTLSEIKQKAPRNCWISMADAVPTDNDDIVSFVKSAVKNDKKRYKALVYKATTSDDMHIINFTNKTVTFKDARGIQAGSVAVPYLMGMLAGLTLNMSAIALTLSKFASVEEPENLEVAINKGEFVLMNDEDEVKVARSVTSLITTGQGITDDMKFILIVEVMDLVYTDIYTTWNKYYKGKYKNYLDNQMLLIGAINSYYREIARDSILDPNFENKSMVDIEAQRLANIPKYGEDEVASWDDNKVMQMTIGTNVFLTAAIKILNATEDFHLEISM